MAAVRLALALLAACAACADARRVTLADSKATAAAHAGHAHGGQISTPGAGALATRARGVEALAPGLYRASYELPLRPMLPGEVLITQAGNTLLDHPHGRVAVLDMQFDIVDNKNASMPLDRLYNHHVRATIIAHRGAAVDARERTLGASLARAAVHAPSMRAR